MKSKSSDVRPVVLYTGVVVCFEARYKMSRDNLMELVVTCLEPISTTNFDPMKIHIVIPYEFEQEWFKLPRGACVGVVDVQLEEKKGLDVMGRVTQASVLTHNLLEDTFFGGNKKLESLFVNDKVVQHVQLVERYLYACAQNDFEYAKYILAWFTVMEKAKVLEREHCAEILFPDAESIGTDSPCSGEDAMDYQGAMGVVETNAASPLGSCESAVSPQQNQKDTTTRATLPPSGAKHVRFKLHDEAKTPTAPASPPNQAIRHRHNELPSLAPCIRKYSKADDLTEAGLEIHDYLFPPISGQEKATLLL